MVTAKEKRTVANRELQIRISKNLRWLLDDRNLKIATMCKELEKDNQVSMDRSALSKFLNNPEKNEIKLPFLVACADYLQVPLDALVSKDIRLYDSRSREKEYYERLLDLPKVMEQKKQEENLNLSSRPDVTFISDPNSCYFEKYYQTYHCYYYSTVSDENKGKDSIIYGKMRMHPGVGECRVELEIDTKSCDERGNRNYKKYIGAANVSSKTLVFHCSLSDENTGEYCDIIFRYSQVNFNKQDCRMALILSTSSTPDKRYPIVHRMFMSREKVKPEDLHLIAPHLYLNYSKIIISEKALLSLQERSGEYKKIVEELMEKAPEGMYMFREREIREVAEKNFGEEKECLFLSELRGVSMAYRYNKVSIGVDTMVRNILYDAGYYQQENMGIED